MAHWAWATATEIEIGLGSGWFIYSLLRSTFYERKSYRRSARGRGADDDDDEAACLLRTALHFKGEQQAHSVCLLLREGGCDLSTVTGTGASLDGPSTGAFSEFYPPKTLIK